MQQIALVTCGGTIAEPPGGLSPEHRHLTGEELLDRVIAPHTNLEVRVINLFDLSSSSISLQELSVLAAKLVELTQEVALDGIVVLVGTNTMEEVAAFCRACLDVVAGFSIPVIFTGSMIPIVEDDSDAGANLTHALNVASVVQTASVLVVFAGAVYDPYDMVKATPYSKDAFLGPFLGYLGTIDEPSRQIVRWHRHDRIEVGEFFWANSKFDAQSIVTALASPLPRVELVTAQLGMSIEGLRALLASRPDGLVIEALGTGQLPPRVEETLLECLDDVTAILLTTRCSIPRRSGPFLQRIEVPSTLRKSEKVRAILLPGTTGRMVLIVSIMLLKVDVNMKK